MKHQKDLSSVERFEFALRARPQDFFANRVRNLCITDTVPTELTHAILSKCTGVQNLAIWQERGFDYDSSRLVRPLASTLTSLDTDRLTLERLYEQKVVFPRLKSLSVLPWPEAARVPNLEWLPVLTKVQLDLCHDYSGTEYPQDVRTVLSSAPMLRTLVLDVNAAAFRETIEEYKEETRIVIMDKALRHGDYIVEWEQFCDVHLHTHDTQ
ncbi:hypothetical protein H0H87_005905 [Tephrocybe sp. NHM501043]|nr:hypothetical protein H0H87_005905 [Tephrocybe sp. NHM501043]